MKHFSAVKNSVERSCFLIDGFIIIAVLAYLPYIEWGLLILLTKA